MSPMTINLDGVEAWKGGALPKGRHRVRCSSCEEGRSSGGHFELHFTWEAIAGEAVGGTIQDWVQITASSLGKVRQLLEACAVPVPAGEFSISAGMFDKAVCDLIVAEGHKPDGTPKLEVAVYQRPAKGSDVPGAQAGEFQHAGAGNGGGEQKDIPF